MAKTLHSFIDVNFADIQELLNVAFYYNKTQVEEKEQYITKKINTTLGINGTQSITMMKYYPFYPFN